MGRALDPKKIKSAQRVLEVLEFFSAERQEGTVMDIARAYDYPQSSTSELLSCLVALGYLHRDLKARTYRPSARVAVLGAWVQPHLFRQGHLLPMMDELAAASGGSVVLASRIGLGVQYFHVVDGSGGDCELRAGHSDRLLHSALGRTLLSVCDRDLVRKLVHRLNAESDESLRVRYDDLAAEIDKIRSQGYAAGPAPQEGMAMTAVLLPPADGEQLAVAIQLSAERIASEEDDLVHLLRGAVSRHLGLSPVGGMSSPTPRPSNQDHVVRNPMRWAS